MHLLRWGLIPSWAKDESIATRLINARGETVAEKPSFRVAYKAHRGIVPASGFYEWKALAGGKHPYYIQAVNDELFGFAGLWERWTKPVGVPLDTFTVVTTDANDFMKPLHDRMPVILSPQDCGLWLAKGTDPELIHQLIAPCPNETLRLHPVSKAVGNVRNEGPELIVPADGRPNS